MALPEPLSLASQREAFTTPQTDAGGGGYGGRLQDILRQRGAHPLPVPTIAIRPQDPDRLRPFVLPGALDPFVALAFTSRSGISAFSRALQSSPAQHPLSDVAFALPFSVAALGRCRGMELAAASSSLARHGRRRAWPCHRRRRQEARH
ncbi:hypothetical protein GUJ93_ZPchr0006g41628 [Zizania palustris]|uniref:Tetrapyrrole biosynthesis uroporphyrinogen III synthase domain-containing protein n=1 Tax=Zizania palustris TaxID=103762 RepID=A0A8J5W4R0_ZIZPA|nr:hypothetical protein GUJ93_ZPchr0006g41628 [Zizania palustris]